MNKLFKIKIDNIYIYNNIFRNVIYYGDNTFDLIFELKKEPYRIELIDINIRENYSLEYTYHNYSKEILYNLIERYKKPVFLKKTGFNKRKNNLFIKNKLFKEMINLKYGNSYLYF